MKKFLATIFLLVFLLSVGFFMWSKQGPIVITSPLPNFLTRITNTQASTLNLWLPKIENGKTSGPQITANSALVYDLSTKKTVYSKNADIKAPMASLTKIMTAVIALENKKIDDRYVVHKEDIAGNDESKMGLSENEVLSLNELLYGLILCSGNDAAETIASNYKGGRDEFIKAMNQKAKSLGLKDTYFCDPSGYCSWAHHTTPYELLVITKYALANPEFAKIAQTASFVIEKSNDHKEYILENETNLLTSYPGVRGVKTGYTDEAGLCLVTYLDYEGHQIIGIVLGSSDRRGDMRELLDYALLQSNITPPPHPDA